MWIEEMFGDLKGYGFDLESTMLRHFSRLSRLTLAVAFLYVWLLSNGGKFIRIGLRHLVDRTDRRDLSLFQIGLRIIERRLLNLLPVSPSLCAYLSNCLVARIMTNVIFRIANCQESRYRISQKYVGLRIPPEPNMPKIQLDQESVQGDTYDQSKIP
jgi:hypothetical protein